MGEGAAPRVVVVGLGPAGPEHLSTGTRATLAAGHPVFLRTSRHPAAGGLAFRSFDHLYEGGSTFEGVYRAIVDELVAAAGEAAARGEPVVYAVPGSPLVAERTVVMLREDQRVDVEVRPALSFLDLAWARLGVDPLDAGVRLVDGTRFSAEAAGERGPLLVGQCWSPQVLSEVKLAVDDVASPPDVTLLHHLGLPDERVVTTPWWELDRTLEPDHLTSLWVPAMAAPVAGEVAALAELARTLRRECPWDREQTHGSLARHLIEEAYETLDAIEVLVRAEAASDVEPAGTARVGQGEVGPVDPDLEAAVAHLREELGDLLFQVVFHATLAAEEGRFTLADVARGIHDKLVARHPHVFGDVTADTPEAVAANWEELKRAEKGRSSVTEGVPLGLPALALAAALQRKARSLEVRPPAPAAAVAEVEQLVEAALAGRPDLVGPLLFAAVDAARALGVDAEERLRATALAFRDRVVAVEGGA